MSLENQLGNVSNPSNQGIFEVSSSELAIVDPYYALYAGRMSQEQIDEIFSRLKVPTTITHPCRSLPNGVFIWLQSDTSLNVYRKQNQITIIDEETDPEPNPIFQLPIDSASLLIGDKNLLDIEGFHKYLPEASFSLQVDKGIYKCLLTPSSGKIVGRISVSKLP